MLLTHCPLAVKFASKAEIKVALKLEHNTLKIIFVLKESLVINTKTLQNYSQNICEMFICTMLAKGAEAKNNLLTEDAWHLFALYQKTPSQSSCSLITYQ